LLIFIIYLPQGTCTYDPSTLGYLDSQLINLWVAKPGQMHKSNAWCQSMVISRG